MLLDAAPGRPLLPSEAPIRVFGSDTTSRWGAALEIRMRNFLGLTMGDTLEDNALRFASEPAYVMGDRQITHAALLGRAKRIASAFEKAGLKRQDRISILSMNSLEYAELLAAGQWSGIVVGTVNFRLAPPEMLAIITD